MSFQASPSTAKLETALLKAQAEFGIAKKDSVNPHFHSKYADLTSVLGACQSALRKYGIFVSQWPLEHTQGYAALLTRLSHGDEYMQSIMTVPVVKQDPQGYKSAITYLKRIMLEACLCIASEDDDANAATNVTVMPPRANVKNHADQIKRVVNQVTEAPEQPPWPDEPMPSFMDTRSPQDESPGEWMISFGKFKGTRLKDIEKPKLQQYIAYLTETAVKTNKPMGKSAQELIDRCQLMWSVNHLNDETIPF